MEKEIKDLLARLKKTIDTTMYLEVERFCKNPSYGWVDTKVYPQTGKEKNDPDNVITLIQGRALEAINEHIDFYKSFSKEEHPDFAAMEALGDSLCKKIDKLVSDYRYVPQFINEKGISASPETTMISMNDLFCAKGLYAWHFNHGTEEQSRYSRERLFSKVKEVLYCESGIFEDRMVGVGAMALVLKYEEAEDAFRLGKELVDYIISKHYNNGCWKDLPYGVVSYYIDNDGMPLINNGQIEVSSGDNIQFTGLTAQFLNLAKGLPFITESDRKWIADTVDVLVSIIRACFDLSYVEPFGFHLWTDGITGKPIDARMGWWQVAEAARGCVLVSSLAKEDSGWIREEGLNLIKVFENNYKAKSPIGIAVQQLEPDGSAVFPVPGNPDIDAGYHTGLTHIAMYNQLSSELN